MNIDFKEMLALYNMGLHETGYFKYGEYINPNKVSLPIIRRLYPTIIANDIIGVQPMTGPVGQIHTLRTRYKC